jgi:hypothetical protein
VTVDIRLWISRRWKSWSVDDGRLESFLVNLVIYVTFLIHYALALDHQFKIGMTATPKLSSSFIVMNHFPLGFFSVSLA